MNSTPFARPQKLIDRANRALDACQQISDAYFTFDNFAEVIEENSATGQQTLKVVQNNPIPDIFEEHVTNALNNLKNAFDQMLFAACEAIDRPLKDGHYPWTDTLTALNDWKLRNKRTGKETIPQEFWDLIRSQQPYKAGDGYEGGHTDMRAIASLANDKHTVGLQINAMVATVKVATTTFQGPGFMAVPMFPRWDTAKNEIEIMRWHGSQPKPHDKHSVTLNIVFDEAALGDDFIIVVPTLKVFATHAQNCLDGFKRRVTEITG